MDQDNKRVVEIVEILLERHFPETPENAKQNLKVVIPSEESVDLSRELREILCSEKSVISLEHFTAMSSTKRRKKNPKRTQITIAQRKTKNRVERFFYLMLTFQDINIIVWNRNFIKK